MLGTTMKNLEEWVMIPPSMAGTWSQKMEPLCLTVFDEQDKEDQCTKILRFNLKVSYVRGFQVDASGNILGLSPAPGRQRFETADQGRIKGYIIITGRRQMLVYRSPTLYAITAKLLSSTSR